MREGMNNASRCPPTITPFEILMGLQFLPRFSICDDHPSPVLRLHIHARFNKSLLFKSVTIGDTIFIPPHFPEARPQHRSIRRVSLAQELP